MSHGRRSRSGREVEPPMPEALAYFLTWTTYGTWLPGDERGWVQYRHGTKLPDPIVLKEAAAHMKEDVCRLDREQRRLVETTVTEHCRVRGWTLHAVHCRSNHAHVVVTANRHPKDVREQFKSWCTRRLKALEQERNCPGSAHPSSRALGSIRENWWTERGSGLFINDEEGLEAVIHYVLEAQDVSREMGE